MKIKQWIAVIIAGLSFSVTACSGRVSAEDYNMAIAEQAKAQERLKMAEAEKESLAAEVEAIRKELEKKESALELVKAEYSDYKEAMSEYEGLASAEAEARRIEAESIAAAKAKEEEESRAAEQAEIEAKEKAGYDTGITYSQLVRTPDDYIGEKVKFKGEILQVMEDEKENQIRLSVHKSPYGWYNAEEVVYCGYDPSLTSGYRLLKKDIVTIYGTSVGLYSYEAVNGARITLPAVWVDKIELDQ